jgi:hypothetical protein
MRSGDFSAHIHGALKQRNHLYFQPSDKCTGISKPHISAAGYCYFHACKNVKIFCSLFIEWVGVVINPAISAVLRIFSPLKIHARISKSLPDIANFRFSFLGETFIYFGERI